MRCPTEAVQQGVAENLNKFHVQAINKYRTFMLARVSRDFGQERKEPNTSKTNRLVGGNHLKWCQETMMEPILLSGSLIMVVRGGGEDLCVFHV